MQSLNVLVAGMGLIVSDLLKSKLLRKLYITSDREIEGVYNIKFNTFKELAQKCKALQIDLVIVEDEKLILEGIADVLKKNFINCVAPISYWTNLKINNNFRISMLEKFGIKTPPIVKFPSEFPVIVKGDGVLKLANSLEEITWIKKEIYDISPEIAKNIYIEKFINGEKFRLYSLYDGKSIFTFHKNGIDENVIGEYSQKLNKMLLSNVTPFIGFINSEVILYENNIYNTSFDFNIVQPQNADILSILVLAIYQKLNEVHNLF